MNEEIKALYRVEYNKKSIENIYEVFSRMSVSINIDKYGFMSDMDKYAYELINKYRTF